MAGALRHWVVVPAAGTGRRFGGEVAKQYLRLAGRPVIEWALEPLLDRAGLQGIQVALAADDAWWPQLAISGHPAVASCRGGMRRSDSVLAALRALAATAGADDWILVHDAARPCLEREDVDRLLDAVRDDAVGGLLATPLADTLKSAGAGRRSVRTIARDELWRALTPQAFRYQLLREALERTREAGVAVTDDAAAIEWLGFEPLIVEGRADNLKITRGSDLELAAAILMARQTRR